MGVSARPIYIVEDDRSVSRALSRLLASAGFEVECYFSGEDFVENCSPTKDARIICDLQLPDMNGTELVAITARKSASLPFIFISALEDRELIEQAKRLGIAFFRKPVDGDALIAALE